jgi:uncharacterized membrane protein
MGFLVPHINVRIFPEWISPLDKQTLSAVLSSIASGMITLTGLVFSLAFVVVQFGSVAYSPRITRLFAHSHELYHSLGIFTGTFLYSLMALRTIGMEGFEVPGALTVWVAFVWLLASVAILARLIRVFTTLTVTNILKALGEAGRRSIGRVYGAHAPDRMRARVGKPGAEPHDGGAVQQIVYHGEPAYVRGYDTEALVALARETDTVIYLPHSVGSPLNDDAAIAVIKGTNPSIDESRIYNNIFVGRERAFRHDPKYAFRLLVDTAILALSRAVNDRTTAVQALDYIESLLCRLGNVDLDIGEVRDPDGRIRLIYTTPRWEDFLQLGLSEIMQYGAESVQVERRLEALFDFLGQAVPAGRAAALEQFREQRRSMAAGAFKDATMRQWADIPDREGIGSGGALAAPLS